MRKEHRETTYDRSPRTAFVERAVATATGAQDWERARVVVTLLAAFAAAIWLASRPNSPELATECTIVILVGAMLGGRRKSSRFDHSKHSACFTSNRGPEHAIRFDIFIFKDVAAKATVRIGEIAASHNQEDTSSTVSGRLVKRADHG